MKKQFTLIFSVLLLFGFLVPVFGQETDFAYLDHLLVYKTGGSHGTIWGHAILKK